jgi:uncharacterized protein (TIGR02246 family)
MSDTLTASHSPAQPDAATKSSINPRNEEAIRKLLDDWTSALRARDLDQMMSFYAPDVVFFDGIAPLQIGAEAYRKNWQEYFNWFPGTVNFETRELKITTDEKLAFSRGLVHLTGINAEGKEDGAWMRETIGYEKRDGRWLISHEHWSMPMDIETGKALTTLEPD